MSDQVRSDAEKGAYGPGNLTHTTMEKDRVIKLQAQRIHKLEAEVEKLRKERDALSTKVTLLTYKLQLSSPTRMPSKTR